MNLVRGKKKSNTNTKILGKKKKKNSPWLFCFLFDLFFVTTFKCVNLSFKKNSDKKNVFGNNCHWISTFRTLVRMREVHINFYWGQFIFSNCGHQKNIILASTHENISKHLASVHCFFLLFFFSNCGGLGQQIL